MSSPLGQLKVQLASAVTDALDLDVETEALVRAIKVPEPEHGDLALGCFPLGKVLGQPPPEVAERVARALADRPEYEVTTAGPYVNVRLGTKLLADTVLGAARQPGFGQSTAGEGKTVVIDFSSPNIAKPLAFHHIRSTVIGQAIGRIHASQGWKVVGINYLGDWGKQFGLLATGFARHGDPARRADAKHLVEVYVKTNAEADVGGRKAAIAAPEEARTLSAELGKAEAAQATAEGKEAKKLAKSVKSLEKRLKALLGTKDNPREVFDERLAELEAKAARAASELPEAQAKDDQARAFLKRMEDKDPDALAEWKLFRDASIEEFQRVYARMGIEFTAIEGESLYQDVLEETVDLVRAELGTRIDDGAEVVDMPPKKGYPPVILKTRDGTTLYVTRDIAAALDRQARFQFDRSLYVVAADQSLHFDQLFQVVAAMGHSWADRMEHVPFGRVRGMSTRRGKIVFLDEVLAEATEKARAVCEASDKIDPAHLEEVVEAVGVGAVIFGDLKNLRTSDYDFRWEDVLDFRGHTAPYVQFSHARACSILRKAGGIPQEAETSRLTLGEERAVLRTLAAYPDAVAHACDSYEPSVVTRYLIDLAQVTASWLSAGNKERDKRVLIENDDALSGARLALVDGVRRTLAHGLGLLGVRAPEAM
ncbi:MAG: arginine--tRNA ligase [Myxococcota bacterium]